MMSQCKTQNASQLRLHALKPKLPGLFLHGCSVARLLPSVLVGF